MPIWLIHTLLAMLGFGLGAVLQKHGVARGLPGLAWSDLGRPGQLVRRLLGSPFWLVGTLLNVGGALVLIAAIHAGPLSVIQPLVNLNLILAIVVGTWVLRERLQPMEWLGCCILLLGGGLLVLSATTGGPPAPVVERQGLVTVGVGGSLGLLLLLLAGRSRAGAERIELRLGLAAGLLFGWGTVYVKVVSVHLRALAGPAAGSPIASIAGDPALIGVVVLNTAGFLLYQAAFSHGRVAVVSPLVNLAGLTLPVLAGCLAFREPVGALRAGGVVGVACGVLLLAGYAQRSTGGIESG